MVIVDMHEVNLRAVDLNLLVVLEALLEERSVTRAAERLHMSQPAVSRALQRLRDTFDDLLIARSGTHYTLTPRAEHLQVELTWVLKNIRQMVQAPKFDPLRTRQVVRMAGPDVEVCQLVPELLAHLQHAAPTLQVELDSRPSDYFSALVNGDIHFVISGLAPSQQDDQLHRIFLESTEVGLMMGAAHPLASQSIDLEAYLTARHGYISLTGRGPAFADATLKAMGKKRNTVLRLTSFASVSDYCERSDLVFMLPKSIVEHVGKQRDVVFRPVPEELRAPELNFYLYWHQRNHRDPMHRWLREVVQSLVV